MSFFFFFLSFLSFLSFFFFSFLPAADQASNLPTSLYLHGHAEPFFFFFSFFGFFSPGGYSTVARIISALLALMLPHVATAFWGPFSSSFFCRFSFRFCSFISCCKAPVLRVPNGYSDNPPHLQALRTDAPLSCIFNSASSCCFRKACGAIQCSTRKPTDPADRKVTWVLNHSSESCLHQV